MADGMPTAAQVLTYTDNLAALFKASYGIYGLGTPGEVKTLSALAQSAKQAIQGDGSTTYGIGAPVWQASVENTLSSLVAGFRYDSVWSRFQPLCTILDKQVKANIPSSRLYGVDSTQGHPFDRELTRKNALDPLTPVTPTTTGTLAATTDAGGRLPNCTSGNAPRVVYTHISPFDYIESLPSPECVQVALSGAQNAYALSITGTVPVGVAKVGIYRSLVGGATGTYYWDHDEVVSEGDPFPTILITQQDSKLRQDYLPPKWMSCLLTPDFAALFALSFAGLVGGAGPSGFGLAVTQATTSRDLQLVDQHMLSPLNVLCGPAFSFNGLGNTPATSIFGSSKITASNTETYTAAGLQASNVAASNVQGFAGSTGIQARVLNALSAAGTVTIAYTYLDAAHGQTPQTTGTATSSAFTSTAVGSLAAFTIPAGRLILSASVTSIAGGMTSGAFLLEPTLRAYLDPAFAFAQPNQTTGGYFFDNGMEIIVP